MAIPNVSASPQIWSDTELEIQAQRALNDFVDRRLAETSSAYVGHVANHTRSIFDLFSILQGLDSNDPDPDIVRRIILNEQLFSALRYMAGPPVSADDLGVLVSRNVRGISKSPRKKPTPTASPR